MKYLIKVDYVCDKVETGGKWLVVETNNEPQLGVINEEPFAGGPLPGHNCKRLHYSDLCDMDNTCNWQAVKEVKQFSEEEAKRLEAREISGLEKNLEN